MIQGKRVRIKKLAKAQNPWVPTPDTKDYKPGQPNPGISLPIEYEVEGTLLGDIELGEQVVMARDKRNGVQALGLFESTPVKTFDKLEKTGLFATENSIYEVEEID